MEPFRQSPFDPSSSSATTANITTLSSSSSLRGPQADLRANLGARHAEHEYMFDKVVTPSDVGKLNRLVIPKQFAEKFFPLDPSSADRGLVLSFEDSTGKQWRFRYSYWNSSQSYVMTKGWSRFVKEKQLGAGDTVTFCRGIGEVGQSHLYIDWHRRELPQPRLPLPIPQLPAASRSVGPWYGQLSFSVLPPVYTATATATASLGAATRSQPYFYQWPFGQLGQDDQLQLVGPTGGSVSTPMVLDSVPVARGAAMPRRQVRLFGVNLDSSEPEQQEETHGAAAT